MTQFPDSVNPIEPEFAEPPKWPKVIGIISIVWGVLTLGCLGCGVVGILMPMMAGSAMSDAFPDGMPPQMTQGPSVIMIVLLAIGFLLSLLLITAGAVLLTRKPAARWLHLVWAGASVLSTFGSMAMQMRQQQDMRQWIRDHPDTKFAQQQKAFGGIGEIVGWGVTLVFGLGYPVFCCVWFGMVKKEPEEYTKGVEQLM
jgi:hypothetical protein